MKNTDISAPDYFHKVVDCQWACPAHTPVPEYIRLIAAGRYSDAYMINWHSNVFPGILGRTCDRPCEPACRRVRVENEPVAICRLKRVAADYKDDIRARLPKPAAKKNGKRIALIGGGPASLTVARDLAPLGYHCVVFDQDPQAGGMIRSQIPKFRLPDSRHRRGMQLHPRPRRRIPRRHAHRQHEGAAGRRLGRDLRRLRRAARPRSRHSRPQRSRRQYPYRHRLAVVGVVRPHQQDRQARDRARRRQHRHGLLPLLAQARRRGRAGRGAFRFRGDEGVALGKGRRHARGHPDPQLPGAQGIHPRQRQTDRRRVREGQGANSTPKAAASSSPPASRISISPATTCWSRSARRTPFPGSSATPASSSTTGACPS